MAQINKKSLYSLIPPYIISISALLAVSLYINGGHFIYVLDDPYIHMAIAKNFVTHGLWAVNAMAYVSATSSPLWSLIISGVYFISGVNIFAPFILNLLFSIAVIITAYRILASFKAVKYINAVMAVFILASPLPALLFTGMEHTAQIFFALLFAYLSAELIDKNKNFGRILPLIIISAILTSLRYEDIFLVFSASLIFTLRKKYVAAFLVFAAAVLPIIIYGLISESHGWMFLPNPVLIKSKIADFTAMEVLKIPVRAVKRMFEPDILFLIPPIIFVFIKNYRIKISEWNNKQVMFFVFLISYVLHMIFAQTGWFFRYEAYLVSLGIVILWLNIYDYLPGLINGASCPKWFIKLKPFIYVVIVLSLCARSASSFLVPQSSNNIYNQQYQMAMFVKSLPAEVTIAANDIGTINYYSDNKIVDLWGLADIDIAKLKLDKAYTTEKISMLTKEKKVKLAMVYRPWFEQYGGLPEHWQKIGEWKMTRLNIVCGNETVSFYSLDSSCTDSYRKKLDEYSKLLPESVRYTIY